MVTRFINHLDEGGNSSFIISVGSWVVHTGVSIDRALVLNSQRHKHFGGLLETVVASCISSVAYSCTNRQKRGSKICLAKVRILNCTKIV